jgi:hypothetical protein
MIRSKAKAETVKEAQKLFADLVSWLGREYPNVSAGAVMWAMTKLFALAICTSAKNEDHLLDGIRVATDGLRSSTTNLWVTLHK